MDNIVYAYYIIHGASHTQCGYYVLRLANSLPYYVLQSETRILEIVYWISRGMLETPAYSCFSESRPSSDPSCLAISVPSSTT